MGSKLLADAPDTEIMQELGRRLESLRKTRGLTQAEAAHRSGIGRRTLYSAEQGHNPTLLTVIRLLRTYGRLGSLDTFIPAAEISPIQELERMAGKRRG